MTELAPIVTTLIEASAPLDDLDAAFARFLVLVRLALASASGADQGRLAAVLLDGLASLEDRLPQMSAVLARCA